MIIEFSLKLFHHVWVKFMEFTFLENALIRRIFTHALPYSKLALNFLSHVLDKRKLLIHPGSIFSKTCFPQQQKRAEKTMICFIKIQLENVEMTGNTRFFIFCMICTFFNCDSFTVL